MEYTCLSNILLHAIMLDNSVLRIKIKNEIPLKILLKYWNSVFKPISLINIWKCSAFSGQAKEPQQSILSLVGKKKNPKLVMLFFQHKADRHVS